MKEHENCIHEKEIAEIRQQIKTLYTQDARIEKTLDKIDSTQEMLLQQVTTLNSTLSTLKWAVAIFITATGGIFIFLTTELIKII
jgi:chromosome segregation ATPase